MRLAATCNSLVGPGFFRLFLALVVFGHHASRLAVGPAAVEVFFCLSGFWIHRMWTERYVRCRDPYVTLVISRAWRLIPTFALISLLTLGCEYFLFERSWADLMGTAGWARFVTAHLLVLGYNTLPAQPLGPAWSLDVELQFYLVAPVLIAAAMRFGAVALLCGAGAVSLGFAWILGTRAAPTFAVFFCLGIAAAHADWRPGFRLAAGAGLAAAALIVGLAVSPWRGSILGGANPGALFRDAEVVNIACAVVTFPFAIFTARQRGGAHDSLFGDLSYIVYLLHWIAICWLGRQAHLSMAARLAGVAMALPAILVCA
jgi:peptidoglycan/LPS O-acetylase OafA/YrhL